MSVAIGIVIRLLGLCGVSLSPFLAGAIVAGLVAGGAGLAGLHLYNAGYRSADEKCDAAALRSQLEAVRRDRDAARLAERDALGKTALIEKQANDDKEGTAAYVEQLKAHFQNACALTDDDLRGMRSQTGAGRAGKRVAPSGGITDAARGSAPDIPRR